MFWKGIERGSLRSSRRRTSEPGIATAVLALSLMVVCLTLVGVLTGSVLAGTTAATPAAADDEVPPAGILSSDTDRTIENASYRIEVQLDGEQPGTVLSIVVEARYPAANETEAQRASNSTLDIDWFDGDDRLERAVANRNAPAESLEHYGGPVVNHVDRSSDDAPHGTVIVQYQAHWTSVTTPYEPPVAELADTFRPGDRLLVEAPGEAERHNADDVRRSHATTTYSWTLASETEPLELVFAEGAFEIAADETPLGPTSGIVLSLGAVVLTGTFLAVRNRDG